MIRRRYRPRLSLALAVASGLALATPALLAKPKHEAQPKVESTRLDIPALKKQLAGSEQEVVAALGTIGESQNPEGWPLVNEVLVRGGTEAIVEEALKAAGKLKSPALSASIAPYVQHRTPEIRRAAARALVKTKGPAAVAALSKALRSGDASVRGTAATGLGELGARESIKDLFNAFDHGVGEAAAAIGQLCKPEECEDFAQRTGRVTFDVMQTGFDQILFRPASEISDDDKLKLVGRMRELGTVEVGKYLADVGERWPKDWSKKVKQAIDSAAHAAAAGAKK